MAVGLPGGGKSRQSRGPSLKGVVMVDEYRGQVRIRAWPRKRGKPTSQKQIDAVEWFREAHAAAKRADPKQQKILHEVTAGTPFLPRDLAIMAMAGRLLAITGPEGRTLKTWAMSRDVSESLDAITDQVGATLIRGVDGWVGTVSALSFSGYVSTTPIDSYPTGNSTSSFAFKGNSYEVVQPGELIQVGAMADWVQGQDYRAFVARINASNVIQEINTSPVLQPSLDGFYPLYFDCGMTILEGNKYVIAVGRTDAGDTYQMPTPNYTDRFMQAMLKPEFFARIASTNPKPGDTIQVLTSSTTVNWQNLLVAI